MHLIWAFRAFFRAMTQGERALATGIEVAPPPPAAAFRPSSEPAFQLLALLQKEGRLIDFLMEDVSNYSDSEVGSAARQIHGGCRKLLSERVKLERVATEEEGARTEIPSSFDASAIALIGDVRGQGPWRGIVRHRGWRVKELNLPTVPAGSDTSIVQPAEIEIP